MEKKEIQLDQEAEKIFQQIQGIANSSQLESYSDVADLLAACLREEEERLDEWRILLIELIHALATYFVDVHFLEGIRKRKDSFPELIGIMNKLGRLPGNDGRILVRYRGYMSAGKSSPQTDYVVSFANVVVDTEIAQNVFSRKGLTMSHLTGRIARAFEIFSDEGVNTLLVRIPGEAQIEKDRLKWCLEVLSRFKKAVTRHRSLQIDMLGKPATIIPILDEKNQPDPNLTLISVVNRLKPEAVQSLVKKVDSWIRSSQTEQTYERYAGIYNAIFTIPAIEKKLVQPPAEMNNLKWLMVDPGKENISRAKAVITRHVIENIPGSHEQKSLALKGVYGRDYDTISSAQFGARLEAISGLLESMEKTLADKEAEKELLENVHHRMEELPENVFDDITIEDDRLRVNHEDQETILERIHSKLKEMVFFYKKRATARKKMKSMMQNPMDFNSDEIETIAKDFGVSEDNAKGILELLKSCFDKEIRFHRATFEKHIAKFAQYEKSVFDILWYYLKEIPNRKDRVGFLNALQALIGEMKEPENAIRVLLEDFVRQPEKIFYPDRNIFMLGNILVRKYNKELNFDIELTPEEVLDVHEGLNIGAAKYAVQIIEEQKDKFLTKIRTIHKQALTSIKFSDGGEDQIPLKFLISLEREAFIFFSLVQGETGRSILRSALREYGDPRSEVYAVAKDAQMSAITLPHLKVIIRAAGRLSDKELISTLDQIQGSKEEFLQLGKGVQHEQLVRKVMEAAKNSIEKILSRQKNQSLETLESQTGKQL
jgi:hypothetical protein